MKPLIHLLLLTVTLASQCTYPSYGREDFIYLCRETFNSTSARIGLYFRLNRTNGVAVYYTYTLRILDLLDEKKLAREDRLERQISDLVKIDFSDKANHSMNIQNLLPGRYEICVNFFLENSRAFAYRSSNSCLHVPWNVPDHEIAHGRELLLVLFEVLIILLLSASVFCIYSIYTFFKRPRPAKVSLESPEEPDISERAHFLVNEHFGVAQRPLESLVHRRIYRRYAHRSPDLNE